ncbi:MAG: hypothetical protein ACLRFM_02160 [Alphaproteobacteria bacterium]
MLNRLRLFIAFICAAACSVANALQPSVRAGSISMNAGIKPASTSVTSTTSTPAASGNIQLNTNRGSATKFTPKTVTVAGNTNNNQNTSSGVSSQDLQDLQNQINELIDAQKNQVTREYVDETVESNISKLNVPAIRTTVSDIQSTTQNLSESVNTIQQRTSNYENTLNQDVDNRLKVRGLIDNNNQIPFAKKSDIEPTVLAQNIVADTAATATLADKIQPSENDIRNIITDELTDVGVLKNDGTLDVEKKGQVVVSESTVTNALRDSQNFKDMVSDEIATKGYVTETALDNRDFVTNTALNAKNFVTPDSDTIKNLATKSEIAPTAIATAIADSAAATAALTGKVGPDANTVDNMIVQKLKDNDIITNAGELNVAKRDDVTPEKIATAIAGSTAAKSTLSGEIGPDEKSVKNLIDSDLKNRGIVDTNGNLAIATDARVSAISGDVSTLSEKMDTLLKDENTPGSIANKLQAATTGLATKSTVDSLSTTVANMNGDITNQDSLLYKIKNNSEIRTALKGDKGDAGTSANATDVASALKTDTTFLQSVKGEKGDAGSGFSFKGNVSSTSAMPQCTTETQSHAYYNTTDELLYICSCTDNTCKYDGVPFRGEKGEKGDRGISAKSVQQQYCEENLEIVKALYSSVTNSSDCADATKFSYAQYSAIMGGAKAYCLSLTQNTLDLTGGIGKKLVTTFGSDKMTEFNNASNAQSRIKLTGFRAAKDANTTTDFMTACEARYNEIMSGTDGAAGADGKSAAETWCEAHIINNNTVNVRLSPAKMARAYDKLSKISSTYAAKITLDTTAGNGYFTDMDACLAAVAADPDLMGGESEADTKYNELQVSEIKAGKFTLANAFSGLSTHRSGFRDTYLKGAAGADGTTFTPSFNATTGQLSWTSSRSDVSAPAAMKVAKTDSELNTLALNAVKTDLGGSSSSDLNSLVTSKATAAIANDTTLVRNQNAVTIDDFLNLVNAGALTVSNGQVTVNNSLTTCGRTDLSSSQYQSIGKLSNKGSFGNLLQCSQSGSGGKTGNSDLNP